MSSHGGGHIRFAINYHQVPGSRGDVGRAAEGIRQGVGALTAPHAPNRLLAVGSGVHARACVHVPQTRPYTAWHA